MRKYINVKNSVFQPETYLCTPIRVDPTTKHYIGKKYDTTLMKYV